MHFALLLLLPDPWARNPHHSEVEPHKASASVSIVSDFLTILFIFNLFIVNIQGISNASYKAHNSTDQSPEWGYVNAAPYEAANPVEFGVREAYVDHSNGDQPYSAYNQA